MARASCPAMKVLLRLIHDGAQPGSPLDEPLDFGLPDAKGVLHSGEPSAGTTRAFDLTLDVKEGAGGEPVFLGSFAHGPAKTRFLYLGWKRRQPQEHPWAWRIKVPLGGIGWPEIQAAQAAQHRLVANVVGRKPHATEAVRWEVKPV